MRSSRTRIVVVLPAPLGPRNPKISPWLDVEVELGDAAVGTVGLGQPLGLDDRCHVVLPAGLAGMLAEEAVHDDRDLALHEGEHVTEFLESGLGFGRPVLDGGQAALRDLAEEAVDPAGAGEELLERLGRRR